MGSLSRGRRHRGPDPFQNQCLNVSEQDVLGLIVKIIVLLAVRPAFVSENVFAWVYKSASALAIGQGVRVRWCLGDLDGDCVGSHAWLGCEKHVARLFHRKG